MLTLPKKLVKSKMKTPALKIEILKNETRDIKQTNKKMRTLPIPKVGERREQKKHLKSKSSLHSKKHLKLRRKPNKT